MCALSFLKLGKHRNKEPLRSLPGSGPCEQITWLRSRWDQGEGESESGSAEAGGVLRLALPMDGPSGRGLTLLVLGSRLGLIISTQGLLAESSLHPGLSSVALSAR